MCVRSLCWCTAWLPLLPLLHHLPAPRPPPPQCYIKYARAIRPRITPAAQRQLVLSYKRLRGDDAAPGSATAYRITVRQLEALVRLSEALARLHLSQAVTRDHVKEVSGRRWWGGGRCGGSEGVREAGSLGVGAGGGRVQGACVLSAAGGGATQAYADSTLPRSRCSLAVQAYRLVKNSIINVEQPDQELADDDVFDDVAEVEVRAHRVTSDTTAEVEFVARYRIAGRAVRLHERSRFVKEASRWFYVDGDAL